MYNPGRGIRLRSSARTSVGKVRENNEDKIHLLTTEQFLLAVVADGMGGAAAGEEASRIAIETIQETFPHYENSDDPFTLMGEQAVTEKIRTAVRSANLNIVRRAVLFPELRGMGTTVTMAFVRGTHVIVAHVGDSRAYLIDGQDGHITQITADHSFVEALVAAGHITPEQAEEHPMRNVLYRALGQAEDIDIDVYYSQLRVGDRMVLCSDGLTRHVKPDEIAKMVMAEDDPEQSVERLISLTNARGGEDNVSVIVIKVEQDPATINTRKRDTVILEVPEMVADDDTLVFRNKEDRSILLDQAEGADRPRSRQHWSANGRSTASAGMDVLAPGDYAGSNEPVYGGIERAHDDYSEFESELEDTQPERVTQHMRQADADGEGRDTSTPEQ